MKIDRTYYVYILASKKNGVLYIGMINDLERRVHEHQSEIISGFTKTYHVKKLVYYELFEKPYDAIYREKAMKKWYRKWKVELIEAHNPEWKELLSADGTILSLEEVRYPLTRV
jgi:putative endonuclease